MAGFSLLDDEEMNLDIPNGDVLEIIPEEQLDAHAPDEALESDVEDIGEISEGLEACHDMLAQAAAANAMNPQAAQFAGLAIQLAQRNIRGNFSEGLNKALAGKGKYGLEAFEDKASGTAYASYAMLGIMDTLKNIWSKIVEFLTKWFDKVATWFNKYLSGAAFAKRKAEAIKKKAEKELGTIKKEDIEMNQTESMHLTLDGKFEPGPSIKATMTLLKSFDCEKFVGAAKTNLEDSRKKVAVLKAGNTIGNYSTTFETAYKDYKTKSGFVDLDDKRFTNSTTQKHLKGVNISGGSMYVITVAGKEVSGGVAFKSVSAQIVKMDTKAKGDKKVPALNTSSIESLADLCKTTCEELIKYKDQYREGKRDLEAFKKEVAELIKDIGDISDEKVRGVAYASRDASELKSGLSAYVGGLASTLSAPFTIAKGLQSQALSSVNSALNYCLRSLSNHKKE